MIPTPDPASLGIFVVAALVLLLTPGPAVLYIVARSIDQGRRAGLVFFLAFLPQFVDVSRGHVGTQILALGGIFVALGLVTDGGFALTAGTAAQWLRGHPRFLASERWISGGMYIGLGVAAALTSGQQKRG